MNSQKLSRTDFRLHTMDTWPPAHVKVDLHHWMLRDRAVRRWLAVLALEYRELRHDGGNPLDGAAVTRTTMIDRLGLASYPQPTTAWATLKFTVRLIGAVNRECWCVSAEMLRLQRAARKAGHA